MTFWSCSTSPTSRADLDGVRGGDQAAGMATDPVAPRRWLQPTPRSDVQVTWHDEDGHAVLSLWRDDRCVGSAPLTIAEAASLTSFLVAHLGERAAEAVAPTLR